MKGLILMQNQFEDTEAFTTIDILRRANIDIILVNMSDNNVIESQYKNKIIIDTFYKNVKLEEFDFLVIPGGSAVYKSLIIDKRVNEAIKNFYENNKLIAAICAAPILLKEYLENKDFTCHPHFKNDIKGKYIDKGVVITDKIITARSMYYTIDFALEIAKFLTGKNIENELKGE